MSAIVTDPPLSNPTLIWLALAHDHLVEGVAYDLEYQELEPP